MRSERMGVGFFLALVTSVGVRRRDVVESVAVKVPLGLIAGSPNSTTRTPTHPPTSPFPSTFVPPKENAEEVGEKEKMKR